MALWAVGAALLGGGCDASLPFTPVTHPSVEGPTPPSLPDSLRPLQPSTPYQWDRMFLPVYGQSLSVGQALPVLSVTQPFNSITWASGVRPQYDHDKEPSSSWYRGFRPLFEEPSPPGSLGGMSWLGETPCSGLAHAFHERVQAEGESPILGAVQVFTSAPGWGATTIRQLSRGSSHYQRLLDQVSAAHRLSLLEGKHFGVGAVGWVQGESDYIANTSDAEYGEHLRQLVADLNSDVRRLAYQSEPVYLVSYQAASHLHRENWRKIPYVALAQLLVAREDSLVVLAAPTYMLDYVDDFHLTGESTRVLGAYLGLAMKRRLVDRRRFEPLRPQSFRREGASVTVTFRVPVAPLVFDTLRVAAATNHGFELIAPSGDPIGISRVRLDGPETVRIEAERPIPPGSRLRYGWSRFPSTSGGITGRTTGARGNLRDSQGERIVFDPQGTRWPMHNWAVIFQLDLLGEGLVLSTG